MCVCVRSETDRQTSYPKANTDYTPRAGDAAQHSHTVGPHMHVQGGRVSNPTYPTQAPLCTLHPSRKSHSSSLPDEGTIPGRACPTSVHMQRNKCLEDRKRPAKCVVSIFLADTSAPRAIVAPASRWWVTSSTDCEESVTTA